MVPILSALGELCSFGTKFKPLSVMHSWFLFEYLFFWKITEFWKKCFLTKVVIESIKMDSHISYAPFWNGISVSNLLILSNLCFSGFIWNSRAKHLCSFFWTRLYVPKSCHFFSDEFSLVNKHRKNGWY